MSWRRGKRRAKGNLDRGGIVPCTDERPGAPHNCNHGTPRARRSRLARQYPGQAYVNAGYLRCRGVARVPATEISRPTFSYNCKSNGRNSMSSTGGVTRRDLFMKIGIFCNGIVGVILAVPIVRY